MSRLSAAVRSATVALVAIGVTISLTACQGVYDLPLPGGAAGGGDVYRVSAEFADVLDLVPQSSVKVNQVTVGTVEKIELNGWSARVTVRLPRSVRLPDNAVASLRQTSLLGEKYVELAPPTGVGPIGSLGNGDNIPLARTGRNTEVEEVLSALSLLLNGGGVAQLKVIERELSDALGGNETQIRDLIAQLDTFVGGLDRQKAEIVRAIEGIDALSATVAARRGDLAAALEALPKGLKVLADQRKQLTRMLTALSRLGAVGTRVIRATKADTVANLRALAPVLGQLASAGDKLPRSLQLLLTYPFPDEAAKTVHGDYTNLYATADLDLRHVAGNLGTPTLPLPGLPGLPGVPPLPTVPGLPVPKLPIPAPTVPPQLPLPPLPPTQPPPTTPPPTTPAGAPVAPSPTTPPCVGVVCLGQAGQSSPSAFGSADYSWLMLMRTGGAA